VVRLGGADVVEQAGQVEDVAAGEADEEVGFCFVSGLVGDY